MEKGIVSLITKDNTKYYQASDPSMLDKVLKEKELKLQGIMPELYTLFNMKKREVLRMFMRALVL